MRFALLATMMVVPVLSACQPQAEPTVDPADTVVSQAPAMPVEAPPQEETVPTPIAPSTPTPGAGPASCLAEIGEAAAARLVERCIQVSPATRPPCNVANPCELIQGEIDRSCAMFGPGDIPAECAA